MLTQQNENPLNFQAQNLNTKNQSCIDTIKIKNRTNMQPIWTKLRQIKKYQKCQFCRKSIDTEKLIKEGLQKKLLQNDNHFYTNTIDNFILKKRLNLNIGHIRLRDSQFNEKVEFMNNFLNETQSSQKVGQLIQYYRYYRQFPMCFNSEYFNLLFQYQQRKKIVEYNRLKVLLSLDPTEQGNFFDQKNKQTPYSNNILDLIDSEDSVICPRFNQYFYTSSKEKSLLQNQQSSLLVQLRNKMSKEDKNKCLKNQKKHKNRTHFSKKSLQKEKNRKVMSKKSRKPVFNSNQAFHQMLQTNPSIEKTSLKNKKNKSKPKQKTAKKQTDNALVNNKNISPHYHHLESVSSVQMNRISNEKSRKKSHKITKSNFLNLKQTPKASIQQQQQKKLRKNKSQHKSMDFELFFKKANQKIEKSQKNESKNQNKSKNSTKNLKGCKDYRVSLFDQAFISVQEQKKAIKNTITLAKIKIKKQKQQIVQGNLKTHQKSRKTLQVHKSSV